MPIHTEIAYLVARVEASNRAARAARESVSRIAHTKLERAYEARLVVMTRRLIETQRTTRG